MTRPLRKNVTSNLPDRTPDPARDPAICTQYLQGETLLDISERFLLSPVRIRQILDANCIPRRQAEGHTHEPEYALWVAAKTRCHNKNYRDYYLYGGRGIKMCPAWKRSFAAFYRDMGPRPSESHSLDRVDPDGDYCPENCRWSTPREQNLNRRNTVWVVAFGERKCLEDWASDPRCKIGYAGLRNRLLNGMEPEEAMTKRSQLDHHKSATHKECSKCGRIKLRCEFNLNRTDFPEQEKGKCKECQARQAREAYAAKSGLKPKLYVGVADRECGRCGAIKPNDQFYLVSNHNAPLKPGSVCIDPCRKEINREQKVKRAAKKSAP